MYEKIEGIAELVRGEKSEGDETEEIPCQKQYGTAMSFVNHRDF